MKKTSAKTSAKPDSLLLTIGAVAQFALVVIGLVGISLDIFKDQGLLKQLLGHLIDSRLGLASIPLLLVVLYIANKILLASTDGKKSFVGDLPLYIMMIFGLYFLYQFLSTGGI